MNRCFIYKHNPPGSLGKLHDEPWESRFYLRDNFSIYKEKSDFRTVNSGGILVSYSSKSDVRRALVSSRFNVTKVPGPPGEWDMIRAIKR